MLRICRLASHKNNLIIDDFEVRDNNGKLKTESGKLIFNFAFCILHFAFCILN